MGGLKIGVALWSLGPTSTEEELVKNLDATVEIGLKGVQPWCVDGGPEHPCVLDPDRCVGSKRTKIRKMIEGMGLTISGFCAQLGGSIGLGGLDDKDDLAGRIEKTKKSLTLAAELGGPIVTTHPGKIPSDRSDSVYKLMLDSIGEIARHGEKVGAVFAIETGQEPAETLKGFIEDIGSEALRVNYDPANMLPHGTVEGAEILAPYIVHTHAKDRDPKTGKPTVGQGAVPWDEYLAVLKKIGYNGWYAIEDESGENVVESVRAGLEFLRRY